MNRIKEFIHKIRDLTAIGAADIGGNAIAAAFWFFIASTVGAENYGQISYFIAIAGITSTISLVGASNVLLVHVPKGVKIQPVIFLISVIFSCISAIILFIIFYKFELSIVTIGFVIFNLAISELLGLKLYRIYFRYIITQKILMVIFGISLYYIFGLNGVILGVGISYLPYLTRIVTSFKKEKIDFSLIRTRSGFVVNSYILDLSNAFIGSIDKIIVGPLFGFLILGNYQLGVQFLMVLYIIPNIFYKFLLTQESSGNPNKKLVKFIIATAVILALLGIFVSPMILPILFPKFTEAVQVLQIVSVAVIPNTINLIFTSRFLSGEKSKIVLCGSMIFLASHISGIVILGNAYGINGIAVSLVLSEIIHVIYYIIIQKTLKVNSK